MTDDVWVHVTQAYLCELYETIAQLRAETTMLRAANTSGPWVEYSSLEAALATDSG